MKDIVQKCTSGSKGIFAATAAAACMSVMVSSPAPKSPSLLGPLSPLRLIRALSLQTVATRPTFAATAAELAAEIVDDDEGLGEEGTAVLSPRHAQHLNPCQTAKLHFIPFYKLTDSARTAECGD